MKVFSYDSPVWRFMGRLVDFLVLTILWVITSLPVITIGVSTTTVYYITLKMTENQDEYLIPMYFKNFKKLFREALPNSLVLILPGVFLAGDIFICYRNKGDFFTMLLAAFVVLACLYLCVVTYFFPLMARINQSVTGLLKTAFYLAIRYVSWTILLLVIPACIFTLGVFVFWPVLLVAVGLTAYLQSLIFRQIFKQQGWSLE